MTTVGDIEAFIAFINEFYVGKATPQVVTEVSHVNESGKFLHSSTHVARSVLFETASAIRTNSLEQVNLSWKA